MTDAPPNKRTALVTGASRGIGKSIAIRLAQQDTEVYGTATTEAGAQKISGFGQESSLNITGIACDVNSQEQVNTLRETIPGPLSILVNNAGITRDNLMMRMSEEDWEAVIDTNLRSVFRLCKLFMRDMIKQRWGRIINIASVVGSSGNPGQANYTASKAGVVGMSKSLALEIASRGVTVNTISPGFIETDMTSSINEAALSEITKRIPAARFGQADEVAALAAFLASPESAYITGENIQINGGLYMG